MHGPAAGLGHAPERDIDSRLRSHSSAKGYEAVRAVRESQSEEAFDLACELLRAVGKSAERIARLHVPELHDLIRASAGEKSPVGRERQIIDFAFRAGDAMIVSVEKLISVQVPEEAPARRTSR